MFKNNEAVEDGSRNKSKLDSTEIDFFTKKLDGNIVGSWKGWPRNDFNYQLLDSSGIKLLRLIFNDHYLTQTVLQNK